MRMFAKNEKVNMFGSFQFRVWSRDAGSEITQDCVCITHVGGAILITLAELLPVDQKTNRKPKNRFFD